MQGDILSALAHVPNIVQKYASGELEFGQSSWKAILIKPYGRLLEQRDEPQLYAQSTYDMAVAIEGCAERYVAHRDVTSNNILIHKGRGVMGDFSAAKVCWFCCVALYLGL